MSTSPSSQPPVLGREETGGFQCQDVRLMGEADKAADSESEAGQGWVKEGDHEGSLEEVALGPTGDG